MEENTYTLVYNDENNKDETRNTSLNDVCFTHNVLFNNSQSIADDDAVVVVVEDSEQITFEEILVKEESLSDEDLSTMRERLKRYPSLAELLVPRNSKSKRPSRAKKRKREMDQKEFDDLMSTLDESSEPTKRNYTDDETIKVREYRSKFWLSSRFKESDKSRWMRENLEEKQEQLWELQAKYREELRQMMIKEHQAMTERLHMMEEEEKALEQLNDKRREVNELRKRLAMNNIM